MLKEFTRKSKSVTSNINPQFRSLFVALKDNGEISALRSTLRYLCEHKYEVDEDKLKQSFEHSGSE